MNSFGRLFRVSIFGESHGSKIGVVIDGIVPGLRLEIDDLRRDLLRRKGGYKGTTARVEDDQPVIVSGLFNGYTTGSPLTILFDNNNINLEDYNPNLCRPGHGDFVYKVKYRGYNDYRGGGYSSGRLTAGLVSAGYFAKLMTPEILYMAEIIEVGGVDNKDQWDKLINDAVDSGDSLGGVIELTVKNVPIGLGEPFFDSLESLISRMLFSIPAVKGVDFGAGFRSSAMRGSEYNDPICDESGKTATNNAGGINAGISNGNDIVLRVAVRPPSSIKKPQYTFSFKDRQVRKMEIEGRHDSCIALRMPVIVENAVAIVFADLLLIGGKNKESGGKK